MGTRNNNEFSGHNLNSIHGMVCIFLKAKALLAQLMFTIQREYRQSVKTYLAKNKKTQVENILALLVESGILYCTLWV